ncbi:hypothetical protein BaRGS_00020054 [Batillaria attramentaria]|uniref:ARID domain-containing protein n=1 Tax=Batillaria attramentaria TaxID=370345 RepID=A0ABD0KPB3_9CAEN
MWYFWLVIIFILMSCFGGCGYYRRRRLAALQQSVSSQSPSRSCASRFRRHIPSQDYYAYTGPGVDATPDILHLPPPYTEVMQQPGLYPVNKMELPPYPGPPEAKETIDWIQCDNPHCLKWRKVGKEEIQCLTKSDKWYCTLNKDLNFSSCDVPEEDTGFYDKLADRAGLKYIKSEFTPGALVWARMDGYCSWPALVTTDPASEYGHLARDEDGSITHYHVEFLGSPHTHGWVCTRNVRIFTADSVDKHLDSSKEMYKKNERAFEHDVSRFMIRNGMKPCKGPLWQNQRISLFQLFLAVHERGGYEKVTKKRLWATVYRELTDSPSGNTASSAMPKTFYQRYLYPYELFIRGQDYDIIHKSTHRTEGKRRKTTVKNEKKLVAVDKTPAQQVQTTGALSEPKDQVIEAEDDDEIRSDVLENMLRTLEDNYFTCADAEEERKREQQIDITFYDESTPEKRQRLTLADFEDPPVSGTDTSARAAMVCKERDESDSTADSSHDLLHQLQILQQGIDFIHEQMDSS